MRVVDMVLVVPLLPLAVVLAAYLGPSLLTFTLVIGLVSCTGAWPWWVVPPGALIALLVLSLALVRIGLEARLKPAMRGRVAPTDAARQVAAPS